jgi:hypothetical protein
VSELGLDDDRARVVHAEGARQLAGDAAQLERRRRVSQRRRAGELAREDALEFLPEPPRRLGEALQVVDVEESERLQIVGARPGSDAAAALERAADREHDVADAGELAPQDRAGEPTHGVAERVRRVTVHGGLVRHLRLLSRPAPPGRPSHRSPGSATRFMRTATAPDAR